MDRKSLLSNSRANKDSTLAAVASPDLCRDRTAKARLTFFLTQMEQETAKPFLAGETIAAAYAALGDKDKAFALLNKACDERSSQVIFINVDPAFDSLRDDPRFAGILARIDIS